MNKNLFHHKKSKMIKINFNDKYKKLLIRIGYNKFININIRISNIHTHKDFFNIVKLKLHLICKKPASAYVYAGATIE